MNEKDFQIIDISRRIEKLEKENAEMKYVIKSIGDLAFANNDAIESIKDNLNKFLDKISTTNKE